MGELLDLAVGAGVAIYAIDKLSKKKGIFKNSKRKAVKKRKK